MSPHMCRALCRHFVGTRPHFLDGGCRRLSRHRACRGAQRLRWGPQGLGDGPGECDRAPGPGRARALRAQAASCTFVQGTEPQAGGERPGEPGACSPPPEVILGVPLRCPSPSSCLPGCPDGATRGKECWEEQPSRERRPVLGLSPGGKGPGHSVSSCSGAAANHQHEFRGRCPWILIPMEKFLRLPFSFRTSV